MTFNRIFKLISISLIITLMVPSPSSADVSEKLEELRKKLATEFNEDFRDDLTQELLGSGLADSDVDRTISILVDDVANCLILAITEAAERKSIDLDAILPIQERCELGPIFRDEAEIYELGAACLLSAISEAGIKLD